MSPIVWRPPTRLLMADADPVQPGGDRAGWISGSLRGAIGGARSGSGLVAGAVTIAGGAITAVAAPTSGGGGYPASTRFEVEVVGDGAGARVQANTNASGVVGSFTVLSPGAGYSTASVRASAAAVVDVLFDGGPTWHQYPIAVATASDMYGGRVGLMEISASSSHADGFFPCGQLDGRSESYFIGLENSGYPSRGVRLQARFMRIRCHVAMSIGLSAQVGLALQVA